MYLLHLYDASGNWESRNFDCHVRADQRGDVAKLQFRRRDQGYKCALQPIMCVHYDLSYKQWSYNFEPYREHETQSSVATAAT